MRPSAIFAIFSLAVGVVPSFAHPSRSPRSERPSSSAESTGLDKPATAARRRQNLNRNRREGPYPSKSDRTDLIKWNRLAAKGGIRKGIIADSDEPQGRQKA
ncbi:hypothetical protein F5148DRAFT_1159260 [Russula earlei]|uniref:Uncharacterized protein n=1 Tax=Russula earlei TaxID=71964 RepID=A0ACC0UN70_9AGAM|nr:hypothetical protein F5148DRAFT_1159260 [Russula earlei]